MSADLPDKRQLDQICDLFEERWAPDARPDFFAYLDQVNAESHEQLLRMLLEVDIELRQKLSQTIVLSDYTELGENAIQYVDQLISPEESNIMLAPDSPEGTLATTTAQPPSSGDPTQIGPYKLLQQIGQGGMGSVWMAEQEKPVRRQVALKLVRADMGSKEIIARFEAERQALAMMDHPNIATVLDAGTTPKGSPYFVMELVKGVPITQYCDQNKLSISERLELFIPVCDAIQHAHQKGIIHRDIKPSNVLVYLYDGKPVPKVIDFGLAKALQHQQKLTDKTLFTQFGQVVGTLQYMSPEQAEMNQLDVDTRADIYSLGVMLYELLTGSTPIEADTARKQAILKVLETIRDQEPPRPSARLNSATDVAVSGISAQRRIEPSRLKSILRGELDWVVMKALEKDRTRRYPSASDFGRDIERYLTNDPVEARPPSTAYRFKKFVSRNRALTAYTTLSLALLLCGIVGTTWGYFRAEHAREQQAVLAEQEREARNDAERQKEAANRRFSLAVNAIQNFYDGVARDAILNRPDLSELRQQLLFKPVPFLERLKEELQGSVDSDARYQFAWANCKLSEIHANAMDHQIATESMDVAIATLRDLIRDDPTNRRALKLYLQCVDNRIMIFSQTKKMERGTVPDPILELVKDGCSKARQLMQQDENPEVGVVYGALLVYTHNASLHATADVGFARKVAAEAKEIAFDIDFDQYSNTEQKIKAAGAMQNLAFPVLCQLGELEEAATLLDSSNDQLMRIIEEQPTLTVALSRAAEGIDRSVIIQRKLDPSFNTLPRHLEVYQLRQRALSLQPGDLILTHGVARAAYSIARRYWEANDFTEVVKWTETAEQHSRKVLETRPTDVSSIVMLQMISQLKGNACFELDDFEQTITAFEVAGQIDSYHGNQVPGENDAKICYANARLGRTDAALKSIASLKDQIKDPGAKCWLLKSLGVCAGQLDSSDSQEQVYSDALDILQTLSKEDLPSEQRQELFLQLDSDPELKALREHAPINSSLQKLKAVD